jgi:hypothetical protein
MSFDSLYQFLCINFSTLLTDQKAGTMVVFLKFHMGISFQGEFHGKARLGTFGQAATGS